MNYRVYADGDLIYDTSVDDSELALINPVLNKEVSCAGSFEFTLPVTHFFYENIKRFNTKIFVYRNDETSPYWDGRVFDENSDILNNKNIYCEGSLSYFNDTHQPQREYNNMNCRQILEAIVGIHNSKVDTEEDHSRHFEVGIAPGTFNDDKYFYTQYEATLDAINNLAEVFDCEIRIRWNDGVRYIDLLTEGMIADVSTQQIIFGENLLDFTRSYDMSNLCTVLLPLGKMKNGSGHNRDLGNIITDSEFDSDGVHDHTALSISTDEETGFSYIEESDTSGTEYGNHYKTRKLTVHNGEKFYLTSRLQKGTGYCFWVICEDHGDGVPIVMESNVVSSGEGVDDKKETEITIPEGASWLFICGNDYNYPFFLYRSKEIPDNFDDYITAEKANNGSLYIKAVPRDVTIYHADGTTTVETVDPLDEWGYVEKTLEIDIPEKILELPVDGDTIYQGEEQKEFRASKYVVTKANEYLTDYQFDNLELEVNAVDLSYLNVDYGAMDTFMKIRAISPKHGLNRLFPINKVKIDMANPENNTYSLGSKADRNLTAVNNAIDSELFAKIAEAPPVSSVLESAKENAAQLILGSSSGYISFIRNEDGTIQKMIITHEPFTGDLNVSHWEFNANGLGYFQNGVKTKVAMDLDGNFVADAITTGTMYAERVKGGTLTLGAYSDATPDGSINVRAANGVTVFSADKDKVVMSAVDNAFNRYTVAANGEFYGRYKHLDDNDNVQDDVCTTMGLSAQFDIDGATETGFYVQSAWMSLNATKNLFLDLNQLDVADSGDDHARSTAISTTMTVGNRRYTFKHGILVKVETDEQEPEPEEGE